MAQTWGPWTDQPTFTNHGAIPVMAPGPVTTGQFNYSHTVSGALPPASLGEFQNAIAGRRTNPGGGRNTSIGDGSGAIAAEYNFEGGLTSPNSAVYTANETFGGAMMGPGDTSATVTVPYPFGAVDHEFEAPDNTFLSLTGTFYFLHYNVDTTVFPWQAVNGLWHTIVIAQAPPVDSEGQVLPQDLLMVNGPVIRTVPGYGDVTATGAVTELWDVNLTDYVSASNNHIIQLLLKTDVDRAIIPASLTNDEEGVAFGPTFGVWTAPVWTWQPPRVRFLIETTAPSAEPPLRQWPRTDGLGASSTPRVWPPSRSAQGSNRVTGYL